VPPPPPHLRTETDPVFEKLCFLVSRMPNDGQSKKKTTNSGYIDLANKWRHANKQCNDYNNIITERGNLISTKIPMKINPLI
jgi:hypothetical protein